MGDLMKHHLAATALASCAAGALLSLAAPPAYAQPQTYAFDIPAQDLASALRAFARQSRQQVIFSGEAVRGKKSRTLKGSYDLEAGLGALIGDDGLVVRRSAQGVFMVGPPSPQGASDAASVSEATQLSEIIVTGTRLAGGPVAPVARVTSDQIAASGATNVSQALAYLPQVSFSANANYYAGSNSIQLRGLAAGATLILVNGQRVVTSGAMAQSNYFDVNAIPMAMVERIEVLANSASAVYGADAVGGVVNVILKKRVDAAEAGLYYGAADGGAIERRATLILPVEAGPLTGAVSFEAFENTGLRASKRALTADQDRRQFGGVDSRSVNSNPATICSVNGANLPGLGANCAAVPTGSSGVALSPADFLATQGVELRESAGAYGSIIPAADRYGLTTYLNYAVSENVDLTLEGFASRRIDRNYSSPTGMSLTVPASNPYNPFGVAVLARYLLSGLGPQESRYETDTIRPVVGLKVRNRGWTYDLTASGFWDDNNWDLVNRVDAAAVIAAVNATDPASALNVFQDGPGGSQALLDGLVAPARLKAKSRALQANALARGTLFSLPAGEVQLALGGEWRDEVLDLDWSALGLTVDDANRQSAALFGEAKVPLISSEMNVPFVTELTGTIAARWDHYSDIGGKLNPQFGLLWRPIDPLLVRASYSRSFRAPTLFNLYQPRSARDTMLTDPVRNETYSAQSISGGNPDLKPERGESYTIGFEAKPSDSLSFSADYWSISLGERFATMAPAIIMANESAFPGRVVRAAPTSADIAAGLPGRILTLESTSLNFGALKTDGLDLAVHKALALGDHRLGIDVTATRVFNFETRQIPGVPLGDIVGLSSTQGTVGKWRGTASLNWAFGPFGAQASARYYSQVKDTANGVATGRKIPSRVPVDLQASVDLAVFEPWLGAGALTNLRVGVINAFDDRQYFSGVWSGLGYDPTNSDFRGRFAYISLTQRF